MLDKIEKKWADKKVFIKLKNSSWTYLGKVIDEDKNSITIIDINNKQVRIALDSIEIIKEDMKYGD